MSHKEFYKIFLKLDEMSKYFLLVNQFDVDQVKMVKEYNSHFYMEYENKTSFNVHKK